METNKISIIMPLYNAENVVEPSVQMLQDELSKLSCASEILLRDDASHDQSYSVATQLSQQYANVKVYRNDKNRGLGATLKQLFEDAQGDVVIYVDADLPFGSEVVSILHSQIQDADMVVASRYKDFPNQVSFLRKIPFSAGFSPLFPASNVDF